LDWELVNRDPNNVNRYTHTFEKLFAGTYLIEVRDTSECYVSMEVNIDYDRSIFIPNVFTPNNDNVNDVFYIRNLPETGAKLVVTNRWGNVVFETDDYNNNWDGGEETDGVYFYRLKIDEQLFSGWVEIWRGQAE
ncbi:MAG: gliding motility-associated C-terminal domain-containing protein, partial [Cyclobacteriaceae bacterium]